jgi:hypothetical protein
MPKMAKMEVAYKSKHYKGINWNRGILTHSTLLATDFLPSGKVSCNRMKLGHQRHIPGCLFIYLSYNKQNQSSHYS